VKTFARASSRRVIHSELMRVVIEYCFHTRTKPTRPLSVTMCRNTCAVLVPYTYVSPLAGGCESYDVHSRARMFLVESSFG
jgi:hypothetical protein